MQLEGAERVLEKQDLIVSKTDVRGYITYANDVFLRIAEFRLRELIGKPHSIVRSKAMPRAAFKLVWDKLLAGEEVFAYVVNKTKNDNHYWVFAHMTPTVDEAGQVIGFHSNRRRVKREAVNAISEVYDLVLAEEARHRNGKQSLAAGYDLLTSLVADTGMEYDEYVQSL